jgi:preprotein translocase subunit SecG
MTEHQIHILTRVVLALVFFIGLIALFAFSSRRRTKKMAAEAKKKDEVEFLNFDEARRRRANDRRGNKAKKARR